MRSPNHCCSGKGLSIKYYEFVSVFLSIFCAVLCTIFLGVWGWGMH